MMRGWFFLIRIQALCFVFSILLCPVPALAAPSSMTDFGNGLILAMGDGTHNSELWRFDGATATMAQIWSGPVGANPRLLTVVGATLFFAADDAQGPALWKSDGTPAGTALVSRMDVRQLLAAGNTLYIRDDRDGAWQTDSTAAKITKLPGYINYSKLFFVNDTLYYTKNSVDLDKPGTHQAVVIASTELYKFDSAARQGVDIDQVSYFCSLNSPVFTTWGDSLSGVGGGVFYSVQDYDYSHLTVTLKRSTGTAQGSTTIKTFSITARSLIPISQAATSTTLFFSIAGGLWMIEGANPGKIAMSAVDAAQMTPLGRKLIFVGRDPAQAYGTEPWVSDGTPPGTFLLKDITTGPNNSTLGNFTAAAGKVFFTAGPELWVTDGTPAGTVRLKPFPPDASPAQLVTGSQGLYFITLGTRGDWTLWHSAGAAPVVVYASPPANVSGAVWPKYE